MSEYQDTPWLVMRTKSRHEGVVEQVLKQKEVVAYLPKRRELRSYQGRKRTVDYPLFPGYLFVRPRADQYEGMRYIRGSCGLVLAADSKPARLPERDLAAVKVLAESDIVVRVDETLMAGQRVKVIAGPLTGLEGELVRVKNRELLVVNVELVNSSMRVEVGRDAVSLV